jgi:hypothetical protein
MSTTLFAAGQLYPQKKQASLKMSPLLQVYLSIRAVNLHDNGG